MRWRVLALLAVASSVSSGAAAGQGPRVTVLPARPAPGAIVRVTLSPGTASGDSVVAVTGIMSGEPLHFRRARTGVFRAIGAVPVDSAATTSAQVIVAWAAGRADTIEKVIELPTFPPPSEQLAR